MRVSTSNWSDIKTIIFYFKRIATLLRLHHRDQSIVKAFDQKHWYLNEM